uniref:Uncharacterized protein n=1 Tax=Mola mola TaxID=94237 RepID=A0A3Q3VY26_MOLML
MSKVLFVLCCRAIILHAGLRVQPMLEQLNEGLQLNGLLSLIKQYPKICQPLFVSGENLKVNAEFVMTFILPQLSERGTSGQQVEMEIMNFSKNETEGISISPARFLQWITGQAHVPSEKKRFFVCYLVVSACAKTIVLPVRHMRPYVQNAYFF